MMSWKSVAEELWRRGIDVSTDELEKWLSPFEPPEDVSEIVDHVAKIVDSVEKPWFAVVAINQAAYTGDLKGALATLAESEAPAGAIALWRREGISIDVAAETAKENPKYLEGTDRPVEFFTGIYKQEFGVDTEGLMEKIKDVVESDAAAWSVLRLVDVDAPLAPEAFVERVERAVEVLAAAKEQGVDVSEILKKWDELADQGGERFEKLAEAVKSAAELVLAKNFWDAVADALKEEGIKVFPDGTPKDIVGRLYYLGLVDIEGSSVDIENLRGVLTNLAEILKKARPIAMYKMDEIADALRRCGVEIVEKGEDLEEVANILSEVERASAKAFLETGAWEPVVEAIVKALREEVDTETITEAVNAALTEVYRGNLAEKEDVAQFLEKQLFS